MAEVEPTDDETTTEYLDDTTDLQVTEDTEDTEGEEADETEGYEETETEEEFVKEGEDVATVEEIKEAREEVRKKRRRKKVRSEMERCMRQKWKCDVPLWQLYAKTFVEGYQEREMSDFMKHRRPADLKKFPRVHSEEDLTAHHKCLPLNAFQMKEQFKLPDKMDRSKLIRIWRNMRANLPVHSSKSDTGVEAPVSRTDSEKWPGMWPCTTRDMTKELLERRRQKRKKRKDLFPCDPADVRDVFEDPAKDYSDRKELGHARIPQSCPPPCKMSMSVDRAAGEQPGLVNGDYIIFELPSKTQGNRIYADVCLRGLKGMHLPELGALRTRRKTWKFCFYQAIVSLLVKTQLRYKYAWSANIDYIYDHAWMLYTHMGMINVKDKQRFDDIVVYNYKYSIEVRLIQELNDVPIVTDIPCDYEERNMRRKAILERSELMNVQLEIGSEKITDEQTAPVHRGVRRIEDWLDKLKVRYRNCIFRTARFSVAFWKDSLFWYLYNPYRCDKFGYWDDNGYACIMKFCSKQSLTRHLMILLLRAHVYATPKAEGAAAEGLSATMESEIESKQPSNHVRQPEEDKFYAIQIFHVSHLCCQIHNLKLLQRGAPKPAKRYVKRKTIDDCPFDPLDMRDPCTIEQEEGDLKESIEKPTWLKLYKITWTKSLAVPQKRKGTKEYGLGKMRWHQYVVEESNKLFSLWGEIHITDGVFEMENRGMQTYACYVVCAGMTRIMAPEYWSSKTLDVIVMCGDRYYTHSRLEAEFKSARAEYSYVSCWNRYLMSHFKIGETMFEAKVLPAICGRLYAKSGKYLWQSLEQMFLKYKFGILTCESSCLGVFKFCGAYYMCDVNSLGPPLFSYGEGAVYLLRATYLLKFITVLVLTIGSPECSQFALNPIEILKVVDVGPSAFPVTRAEKKEKKDRAKRVTKVECPYDEEKKKQMKKWKHKRAETIRLIDKLCCKGER
ncbi:hypothetical protein QLX08_006716 [Tetragonisca angustula]|uniref:Uncharacterized protein n=1 Tax=Tetragonisca angustula TaxID=166442 RepID=A0AAW0ZSA3_9HYME